VPSAFAACNKLKISTPGLRRLRLARSGFEKTHANPDTLRYRSGQAHGNSLNRRAVMLKRHQIFHKVTMQLNRNKNHEN